MAATSATARGTIEAYDREHGRFDGPREPEFPRDYSLLCFEPMHPLRRLCKKMLASPAFDRVILIAIVVSSICLALDSPRLDKSSQMAYYLKHLDVFFTILFFGEMIVKVIALSFACVEGAYLSSVWNQIDCVIVVTSCLNLLADSIEGFGIFKALRVLRAAALRLVSRNAGMKLIITSLFRAMPAVSNVFGVVIAIQGSPSSACSSTWDALHRALTPTFSHGPNALASTRLEAAAAAADAEPSSNWAQRRCWGTRRTAAGCERGRSRGRRLYRSRRHVPPVGGSSSRSNSKGRALAGWMR